MEVSNYEDHDIFHFLSRRKKKFKILLEICNISRSEFQIYENKAKINENIICRYYFWHYIKLTPGYFRSDYMFLDHTNHKMFLHKKWCVF